MTKNLTLCFFMFFTQTVNSQILTSYSVGDSLLDEGNYSMACDEYKKTIHDTIKKKGPFLYVYNYNLGCSYAINHELDSAYKYLSMALTINPTSDFVYDYDFNNLRSYSKWDTLIFYYKKAFLKKNSYRNFPEIAYELSILKSGDQGFRNLYNKKRYTNNHDFMVSNQTLLDSQNLIKLELIIDSIGWPNEIKVGPSGANTAFLILQHSPLIIQKKYITILESEAKLNTIPKYQFAYLLDRIAIIEGRKQTFGTQINVQGDSPTPYPVIDPSNLNSLRKSVGLEPIEEYLLEFTFYIKKSK